MLRALTQYTGVGTVHYSPPFGSASQPEQSSSPSSCPVELPRQEKKREENGKTMGFCSLGTENRTGFLGEAVQLNAGASGFRFFTVPHFLETLNLPVTCSEI